MAAAVIEIDVCPSAEALLAGGDAIEAHIDACGACRAALSYAMKGRAGVGRMGRYELGTVIGAGGMGVVYRAWDPQLGRAVAVKVVSGAGERVLREARSLARVIDRNVCGVFDAGVEGDDVWIAMELIDGVTMREWAAAEGRGAREVERVLIEAGRGIAAAHAAGLVHRDVKPENVLVARDGRVVVTDFGLARVELGAATTLEMSGEGASGGAMVATRSGVVAGTPAYMAPEQITGGEVDARADQFAWAVMAWEMRRGARPFPAEAAARIKAVREGVEARDAVERVLVRGMREAKRERWRDMGEMIAAFEGAVGGGKRGKRAIGIAIAIGMGVAVVGVVGAVMWGGAGREDRVQQPSTSPSPSTTTSTVKTPSTSTSTSTITSTSTAKAKAKAVTPVKVSVPVKGEKARPVDVLFGSVNKGRAEAVIADECLVGVDAKDGTADWGRVVRWEEVEVGVAGRARRMVLYEVKGAKRTYVFDGRAHDQTLGSLDAAVGEEVVVCPGDDVDIFELPKGWNGPVNAVNAYLGVERAPRVPARQVRKLAGASGRVMVRATAKGRVDGGWDMGGWVVSDGVKGAEMVKVDHEIWAVVDVDGGVVTPVEMRVSIF